MFLLILVLRPPLGHPPSLPPFLPFRDNSLDVIVGDFALESPLEEHMHDVQV